MAKQLIGLGTTANDGTGSPLRTGGDIINDNATELYDRTDGNSPHQLFGVRVDWSNESTTINEIDLIWAAVNSDAFTGGSRGVLVQHGHVIKFKTTRDVYSQEGTNKVYDVYETYWELRRKLTVTGGAEVSLGAGNTLLDSTNGVMTFAGRKITRIINLFAQKGGFTVDVGETGATAIEATVNAGAEQVTGKGVFVFKGTNSAVEYGYIYNGVDEKIGTGTGITTTAAEFTLLSEVTANPKPDNVADVAIEAIDEGNGIGYAVRDRVSANFGNIGLGALDISTSTTASTTRGGTGTGGITAGVDVINSGANNIVIGSGHNVTGEHNIISGYGIITAEDANIIGGAAHNISGSNCLVSGDNNASTGSTDFTTMLGTDMQSFGRNQLLSGDNNIARASYETVLGRYATDAAATSGTTWVVTDRLFTIGNGASVGAKSDALTILKNGNATFGATVNTKGYTVATLPTGVLGATAYVTDATTPTYLGTLTGGGAINCPVFYNGSAWVSH